MCSPIAEFEVLLKRNDEFVESYKNSPMMQLIKNSGMEKEPFRQRLLGAIQVLSDYFQKVVLLRSVLSETPAFKAAASMHLKEEFCHNEQLMKERNHQLATWDPILEATCSWFVWKMFTISEEEQTVLIHLVLEASGNVFFQAAAPVIHDYMGTEYFKIHAEADQEHEKMGLNLLQDLSKKQYEKLFAIQAQGWSMFLAISERIAALVHLLPESGG
jgi:pyrroloquinoline quinone (PQQ) biosynthesis protein C